jgi:hypothetical protein
VDQRVEPVVEDALEPPGTSRLVTADHQAGTVTGELIQLEAPQTLGVRGRSRQRRVENAPTKIGLTP